MSLLANVDAILALTDEGRFDASRTRDGLAREITALTFDLHLNHMGVLLDASGTPRPQGDAVTASILAQRAADEAACTSTTTVSAWASTTLPATSKRTPKPLAMDRWNMRTPPVNTHPYLRLFELTGAKKKRMAWGRRAKARSTRHKQRKISLESAGSLAETDGEMTAAPLPPHEARRTSPRSPRQRKGRTLRLSTEVRAERRNENVLRSFVKILKSSRSIYGKDPETIRDVFQTVDRDGNGTLDRDEFQTAMHRLGLGLDDDTVDNLMRCIDDNDDGLIAYQELVTKICQIMRQSSRRHIEKASRSATTGAAARQNTPRFPEVEMIRFTDLVLAWAGDARRKLVKVSEGLRRMFSAADKDRNGAISGHNFVRVVLDYGLARDGVAQADVAKVALGIQEKETGSIFYHEFVDVMARRLKRHTRRQRGESTIDAARTALFQSVPRLEATVERVAQAVAAKLSATQLNQVEEFLDPTVKEPTLTAPLFFDTLERLGVTLDSEELLALWNGLGLNERNASRTGGMFDHKEDDARVARLHAVNDSKIISKFMVKHKHHIRQHYSTKIQKLKEKRVDNFRLRAMTRALDRLDDGGRVEHRFVLVLAKIKQSLRLASIGGADVMRIFTLFDEDGDGQISRREFEIAMERLTVELTEEDMDSCFAMLDPNEDDGIDINEFRYAWFNAGKMLRTMDHEDSDSSVAHQAKLRRNEKEELKNIETMYRAQQGLLMSARPPPGEKT
jgi:Ca2+-binding EF-hand superfamily protein